MRPAPSARGSRPPRRACSIPARQGCCRAWSSATPGRWTPSWRRTSDGPASRISRPSPGRTSRSSSWACCGRCAAGRWTGACRQWRPGWRWSASSCWPGRNRASSVPRRWVRSPCWPSRRGGPGPRCRLSVLRCACCCSWIPVWRGTRVSRSPLRPRRGSSCSRRAGRAGCGGDGSRGWSPTRWRSALPPGSLPRPSSRVCRGRSASSRCPPTCSRLRRWPPPRCWG